MNMPEYFNTFQKRMNKDGTNRQDRIKTKKEREFDRIYLNRTEYKSTLIQVNHEIRDDICSLQPNSYSESRIISNLLMSTSAAALNTGDILTIYQKIKEEELTQIFLVLYVDKNITHGYRAYKLILLDSEVNITNEYGDTLYTIPVKFINATATFTIDNIITTGIGYREPAGNRAFITQNFDFLNKGTYFEYAGKGWEISGSDNGISIPNVAYCYLGNKLLVEEEPRSSQDILVGEDQNFFLNNR